MDKETGTQRFRQRMDDIERQFADTLTHHLATQRNEKGETRSRELEKQLEAVQQQSREQKEGAERLIQQIKAERDESRSQMNEVEGRLQKLEQELNAADGKLQEEREVADQRNAAEKLIKQLEAERDESRSQMNEVVEERMRRLEGQLSAAQVQFRQQRETAVKTIRQMAAERDESKAQVGEIEEHIRMLEEELAAVQERLQAGAESGSSPAGQQSSTVAASANGQQERYWRTVAPITLMLVSSDLRAMSVQSNPPLLEIVRNIQLQCQNLLELLRRDESP